MHRLLLILLLAAAPVAAQSGPTVRFAGAVNQDGCPFCCEFNCQASPTPTPEFDAQGRRVYRRGSGQFMLVVEAGPGTSGRQPGSEGVFSGSDVVPISHSSGQPSLQLMVNRNLGDGSAQVDCRTLPIGGVRGFPALDFDAGSSVTTGQRDMACRFELAQTGATACTRDRFGNFAFLGTGTTRQYCFQVSAAAELPDGATVGAVRLRDTNGNLGPRHEFVVVVEPNGAVTSPSPTPTPTPTRALANVAGRVRYYFGDRAVPSATVAASGSVTQHATSQGTGAYLLADLPPGTVNVTPRRVGGFGSPTAITALDAAYVLQVIAGTRTFDSRQRLACDVTGNGTLSALDAARILQRQVGVLARFDAADYCDSDWIFEPVAGGAPTRRLVMPQLGGGSCRQGAVAYEPLAGDAVDQDFLAMLIGDCTGNWQSGMPAFVARAAAGAAEVRLRVSRRTADGRLIVPVAVDSARPYQALDLALRLGPNLRPRAVRKLRDAGEAMVISNMQRPGEVRIAMASGRPLAAGAVLVLELEADPGAAGSDVVLTRADVDDEPALATTGAARSR